MTLIKYLAVAEFRYERNSNESFNKSFVVQASWPVSAQSSAQIYLEISPGPAEGSGTFCIVVLADVIGH